METKHTACYHASPCTAPILEHLDWCLENLYIRYVSRCTKLFSFPTLKSTRAGLESKPTVWANMPIHPDSDVNEEQMHPTLLKTPQT